MRWRCSLLALLALACGLNSQSIALAQGRRGATSRPSSPQRQGLSSAQTPIEEFETMPPADQQKALKGLPPDQRQRLQERLQRFNQLPPEQQQALKSLYNRLHQLPPEKQDAVRKSVNKFSQQTPERQQAIRQELRSMTGMSPKERKAHLSSPEFRRKLNKKEQDIARDMAEVLPPR
jgi:hypothetical protein